MLTTKAPHAFTKLSPAKPSVVYDTYWRFAAERQAIFFRRFSGQTFPWTQDPILVDYKFTNAYRASDRGSQYLIRSVIYEGSQTTDEVLFRVLLFKLFNRIETWELLVREIGQPTWREFSVQRYGAVLGRELARGIPIYSAAYIMPPGPKGTPGARKHESHLRLLETMMQDGLANRVGFAKNMRTVFEILKSYPTIGDFLAYQYTTDINYSELTHFTEMEFVVPGPGARNGLRKCFRDLGGLSEPDILRLVADRQELEFGRLGLHFRTLWGRRLQLIDCQNLFCEVDKYSRVAHPEIAGPSHRKRIKQHFRPNDQTIAYWYPPKWGINDRVAAYPTFS